MAGEFDRYAERYEELVRDSIGFSGQDQEFFVDAKARCIRATVHRHVGPLDDVRALDVGCGVGLLDSLLGPVGELHGVDPSEASIRAARERNPGVQYTVGDGTSLPYQDGAFDVVFASCVVHHVRPGARGAFFDELTRVTRAGGLAIVLEHNPLNPLTRLAVSRCEFDDDAVLLGPRETRGRLRAAGARPLEARYILFFPWRSRLLSRAERALAPVPLGAQYYVAARV